MKHNSNQQSILLAAIQAAIMAFTVLVVVACGGAISEDQTQVSPIDTPAATATWEPTKSTFTSILTKAVEIVDEVGPAQGTKEPPPSPPEKETSFPAPPTRPITLTAEIDSITISITPTIPLPADRYLQDLVHQAQEDLAQSLGIDLDEVELIEIQAVVWPDGSLGCPQPGMNYIQVTQDGALIRLRVGTTIYNYHSSSDRPPFLCEQNTTGGSPDTKDSPAPISTLPPEATPISKTEDTVPVNPTVAMPDSRYEQNLVQQATDDLAQRLSVDPHSIDLVGFEAVIWPNKGLGCPKPGMNYTQVQQEGTLIHLRVGTTIYPYHSGGGKAPFLCEKNIRSE